MKHIELEDWYNCLCKDYCSLGNDVYSNKCVDFICIFTQAIIMCFIIANNVPMYYCLISSICLLIILEIFVRKDINIAYNQLYDKIMNDATYYCDYKNILDYYKTNAHHVRTDYYYTFTYYVWLFVILWYFS